MTYTRRLRSKVLPVLRLQVYKRVGSIWKRGKEIWYLVTTSFHLLRTAWNGKNTPGLFGRFIQITSLLWKYVNGGTKLKKPPKQTLFCARRVFLKIYSCFFLYVFAPSRDRPHIGSTSDRVLKILSLTDKKMTTLCAQWNKTTQNMFISRSLIHWRWLANLK